MGKKMRLAYSFVIGAALLAPVPVVAQQYDVQGVASVDILPGYRTAKGTHMAALRIRLKDGWKTYWRAPGGNGIPPQFRWGGSKNLKAVAFHWPAPKVFVKDGIQTIGFKHELVLPIEFMAANDGQKITLSGEIDFGVCSDVCIPASASFRAELPRDHPQNRKAIRAALAAGPGSARQGGVKSARCDIRPTDDGFTISSVVEMKQTPAAAPVTVIEYAHDDVWVDVGATSAKGRNLNTKAELYSFGDTPFALDRSRLRLTVFNGNKVTEIKGCEG